MEKSRTDTLSRASAEFDSAGIKVKVDSLDGYVRKISLRSGQGSKPSGGKPAAGDEVLALAVAELQAYLRGNQVTWSFPCQPGGTQWQRRVWNVLIAIPYGEVRTYGWVARRLGRPGAARAVGQAVGKNPLPIVIPCHRVIAGDGSLGGFSSGLTLKRLLLALEGVTVRG